MDNKLNENYTQTANSLMDGIQVGDSYGQNLWSLSLTLSHNSSNNSDTLYNSHNGNHSYDNTVFDGNTSAEESMHRLFNITQTTPIEYAMVMYGYIMPFLLFMTLVANLLIVLVLAQKHMRTPTNLVLLSMAVADMLTLVFPSPWYFYMYTLGYHSELLHPPAACYAYSSMIEVIPMFFHTASIWLTILLAGQRYIYICHPVLAKTWCTIPRVSRAIITIFILAISAQFGRFLDSQYESIEFESNGVHHKACQQVMAEWVVNIQNYYFPLYFGFRIIFVNMGPCLALVVLNVFLFMALKRAQRKRKKLFADKRNTESKNIRDSNSTTYMLIVVVTVFLMVEFPMAVATLIHVLANTAIIPFPEENFKYLKITVLITNFIIMLSFPLNFAIYCGMSRQFRETFSQLFIKKLRDQVQGSKSAVTTATNL
ncbi:unnamed protein product [Medioppia subpectinata]|uniref:G-protein coupled receptors family 1 profile domain-containing protein n=1 Tax=Medioppia subpectinata TaxID=1979941 RepID=A0A7R9KLE3_9ACAR|nr:unnamed protein product [Medioppia subpectinata]CAG2105765.1 unnamed protein product [Medioppia subpectinata]